MVSAGRCCLRRIFGFAPCANSDLTILTTLSLPQVEPVVGVADHEMQRGVAAAIKRVGVRAFSSNRSTTSTCPMAAAMISGV